MWMTCPDDFFCWAVASCLLPDSACDKNTIAKITVSEKVSRNTAFDRFMIFSFFSARQHLRISFSVVDNEPQLTPVIRCRSGDTAQGFKGTQAKF
jgi:hypothetical protein